LGQQLVLFWEDEMKKHGYTIVMTSSFSNEEAQHFYRKIGYKDSGSLLLPNEPLEIIFTKHL
jgi:ribosomal protein S18 acetylase RimI-like enzyme